jgi:hypothetical protein
MLATAKLLELNLRVIAALSNLLALLRQQLFVHRDLPSPLVPPRGGHVGSISPCSLLPAGGTTRLARWEHLIDRPWEFTPDSIGGFSWSQLALVSLLSLFMEMLIRWIAAEVDGHAFGLSALALFLPGRGVHAPGGPDCEQDGPALWHNGW